jgi:FkbM family methyltransferase
MNTSSVTAGTGAATFELVLPQESNDPVIEAYRRGDQLNEPLVELLQKLLPSPGTVLDLGCHVGTFSLAAAALGHRVIAVDAAPEHVELLSASTDANGFDRVSVIHAAAGDHDGHARLKQLGLFGFVSDDVDGDLEVPAATVPRLLSEAGCAAEEVGFIKMDIEGSELAALTGAIGLLQTPDAPPILYESNPRTGARFGYSTGGLRTALERLGYRSYRPEPDGLFLCTPLEPQPEAWVDLVALKVAHQTDRRLEVRGPIPIDRLLQKFQDWSCDPDSGVRRHAASELVEHWGDLASEPQANQILRQLKRDESEEVRAVAGTKATRRLRRGALRRWRDRSRLRA